MSPLCLEIAWTTKRVKQIKLWKLLMKRKGIKMIFLLKIVSILWMLLKN
uniref:Uncharacterized protein n=1 Tax=Arundo donax TaxID=35708 RepID=A0A0A8ZTQ2_ARUDO